MVKTLARQVTAPLPTYQVEESTWVRVRLRPHGLRYRVPVSLAPVREDESACFILCICAPKGAPPTLSRESLSRSPLTQKPPGSIGRRIVTLALLPRERPLPRVTATTAITSLQHVRKPACITKPTAATQEATTSYCRGVSQNTARRWGVVPNWQITWNIREGRSSPVTAKALDPRAGWLTGSSGSSIAG